MQWEADVASSAFFLQTEDSSQPRCTVKVFHVPGRSSYKSEIIDRVHVFWNGVLCCRTWKLPVLEIKQQHVDPHGFAAASDVPGLPEAEKPDLKGGGASSGLQIGRKIAFYVPPPPRMKKIAFKIDSE